MSVKGESVGTQCSSCEKTSKKPASPEIKVSRDDDNLVIEHVHEGPTKASKKDKKAKNVEEVSVSESESEEVEDQVSDKGGESDDEAPEDI